METIKLAVSNAVFRYLNVMTVVGSRTIPDPPWHANVTNKFTRATRITDDPMNTSPDPFSQSAPDLRETVYVTVYFALLTLVFSWPVIAAGESFYAFDILNQFLPWASTNNSPANNLLISDPLAHVLTANQLLHEGLNTGHIPYWNPWLFAGIPFEPGTNPVQIALL